MGITCALIFFGLNMLFFTILYQKGLSVIWRWLIYPGIASCAEVASLVYFRELRPLSLALYSTWLYSLPHTIAHITCEYCEGLIVHVTTHLFNGCTKPSVKSWNISVHKGWLICSYIFAINLLLQWRLGSSHVGGAWYLLFGGSSIGERGLNTLTISDFCLPVCL